MKNINELSQKEIQPHLGLVCITASQLVRFRTVTRKRLLQLSLSEQEQVLRQLYRDNLNRLWTALDFCEANQIKLYRLTSALFPFTDTAVGEGVLDEFGEELLKIGDRAESEGIRLVLHPDQFVVLSSDHRCVIDNSIAILETHARVLDMLGLSRSPWNLMNIHGGKSDRAARLVSVIRDLPESIRSRLTLENDEYAYGAEEILNVCLEAGIPMVFDAHHHVINKHLNSYEDKSVAEMLAAARKTWSIPAWQLVHISNGRGFFADPRHSDLINLMPSCYRNAPWIEVEAKSKELAIEKLRLEWMPQVSAREMALV